MRKLNFLFIFLAVLISVDYITSVIGINWLEEMNPLVVSVNDYLSNWLMTFTLLYLLKIFVLIGVYIIAYNANLSSIRKASKAVVFSLIVFYVLFVINNVVLLASAADTSSLNCCNEIDIGIAFNGYATFQNDAPSGSYSNKGGEVLTEVIYTKYKIMKEVHVYSSSVDFFKARFSDGNGGYPIVYNWGETYDLTYNGVDYGDAIIYHYPAEMHIYFVWNDNATNLQDGTVLTAKRKSVFAYDVAFEGTFYDVWKPYSGFVDYSFDDPTFNCKIKVLDSYGWPKCLEDIPLVTNIQLVYYSSTSGKLKSCIDTSGYYINTFNLSTIVNYTWVDYYDESNVIKSGQGYSSSLRSAVPVKLIINNAFTFSAVNESCIPTISEDQITFLFIDSKTSALLDNVNFSISGDDYSDSGIYDYKVTYTSDQLTEGNTYSYTATRDGYKPVSGSFVFTGGQVIKLYFVPDLTEHVSDLVNNTALTFTVVDSETKEPISGAYITVNGETKITNSNGFTWFEVPKNNTYSYTVSAQDYYSVSGSVEVGAEQKDVTVELMPISAIPTTTVGGVDTGTTGGTGSSLNEGINELYSAAPSLIRLAILVALMSMFGMLMRTVRRR